MHYWTLNHKVHTPYRRRLCFSKHVGLKQQKASTISVSVRLIALLVVTCGRTQRRAWILPSSCLRLYISSCVLAVSMRQRRSLNDERVPSRTISWWAQVGHAMIRDVAALTPRAGSSRSYAPGTYYPSLYAPHGSRCRIWSKTHHTTCVIRTGSIIPSLNWAHAYTTVGIGVRPVQPPRREWAARPRRDSRAQRRRGAGASTVTARRVSRDSGGPFVKRGNASDASVSTTPSRPSHSRTSVHSTHPPNQDRVANTQRTPQPGPGEKNSRTATRCPCTRTTTAVETGEREGLLLAAGANGKRL